MENKQKITTFFSQLKILHGAMFIGQALFFAVTLYIANNHSDKDSIFTFVIPIAIILGFVMGHISYNSMVKKAQEKTNINHKLANYRSASIAKWALFEGVTLLAVVALMITGRMIFAAYVVMMLVVFAINRPTVEKVERELGLTGLDTL